MRFYLPSGDARTADKKTTKKTKKVLDK